MKTARTFITPDFLDRVRTTGALATAILRIKNIDAYKPLSAMTTWSLVCEEMVDTEHEDSYYERVVAELMRRNLEPNEINEMRMFAWRTAGWLNFEKMVWDWCSLDESDIERAIEWQLKDREITQAEADLMLVYLNRHRSVNEPKTN